MHRPNVIEVVNLSTKVSRKDADLMARVAAFQIAKHAALKWGMIPIPVRLVDKPSGARLIAIMDDADQADALGYHGEDKLDRPVGRVFVSPVLDMGGAILWDKDRSLITVSSVLSHEVLEMYVDPNVNYWAEGRSIPEGLEYALEVCDPVQADYYDMPTASATPVRVSNFVTPAWFDEGEEGPYDYLQHLPRGNSILPGGYMIVRSAPGEEKAILGSKFDPMLLKSKGSPLARTKQRGTKSANEWDGQNHVAEVEPVSHNVSREEVRKRAEAAGTVFALPREYTSEIVSEVPELPPQRQPDPATIAKPEPAKVPVAAIPIQKAAEDAKARKARGEKSEKDKNPKKKPRR